MKRLDIGQLADPVFLDPPKERAHGPVIGQAGVVVFDRGGEELEEAPRGAPCSRIAGRPDRSPLMTTPYNQ
jgi:hypothetical protein